MNRRPLAVLLAVTLGGTVLAGPALAQGKPAGKPAGKATSSQQQAKAKPAKAKPAKGKPAHQPVTLVGTVTALASDSSTVTVAVKGGHRAFHGRTVVLTVNGATVVRLGDQPATAADLRAGDKTSARAVRNADGSLTAKRINASRTAATPTPSPSASATASPTQEPTPSPTASATASPTEEATASPTASATASPTQEPAA